LAVCFLLQAAALVKYLDEQSRLEALMSSIASPTLPPSQQAEAISTYLAFKPDETLDSYFLLPIFRSLRPTACEVADQGGDCADRSRLMVVLLGMRHIRASKWALYAPTGISRHAVVELRTESGKMVIDPLYNMWFPKAGGGFYDIDDLHRDPLILRSRVLALQADHAVQLNDSINWYPLNQYVYTNARTINWDKTIALRAAYRVLHMVLGERVNGIPRPEFAEQPGLMIIYGLFPMDAVALLLIAWPALRRERRTVEE
jgi:hypothetical protein